MKKIISVVIMITMLLTLYLPVAAHGESTQMEQINTKANASLVKAENLMGINFDRADVTAENVCLAGRTYTEITDRNDIKITVDQAGNIVRYNAIYAKESSKVKNETEMEKVGIDQKAMKESILELFSLEQNYETTTLENYGDYCGYSYIKQYPNGLKNPFESVKVACDSTSGEVIIATKFDMSLTAQQHKLMQMKQLVPLHSRNTTRQEVQLKNVT